MPFNSPAPCVVYMTGSQGVSQIKSCSSSKEEEAEPSHGLHFPPVQGHGELSGKQGLELYGIL